MKKRILKIVGISLIGIWIVLSAFWLVIVTQRQKRFEEFSIAHIELLMQELSATNIKVSIMETEWTKLKEDRSSVIEMLTKTTEPTGKCGEKEGEK